jgi:hypothetical protein
VVGSDVAERRFRIMSRPAVLALRDRDGTAVERKL